MKSSILTLITLSFQICVFAQSIEQQVISSTGTHFLAGQHQISWTIGEPVIETAVQPDGTVTQGFHQTNLLITDVSDNELSNLEISVFPNPSMDFIYLTISDLNEKNAELLLYDEAGKTLFLTQITEERSTIDLTTLASATYFLVVRLNSEVTKTFKVVKQN